MENSIKNSYMNTKTSKNGVPKSGIRFRGKISKMGERFVIYVPKALHEMIRELWGKDVLVIIEEVEDDGGQMVC